VCNSGVCSVCNSGVCSVCNSGVCSVYNFQSVVVCVVVCVVFLSSVCLGSQSIVVGVWIAFKHLSEDFSKYIKKTAQITQIIHSTAEIHNRSILFGLSKNAGTKKTEFFNESVI